MKTRNAPTRFLVVEDAAADRLRIRLILERLGVPVTKCDYAWRLTEDGQGDVASWFLERPSDPGVKGRIHVPRSIVSSRMRSLCRAVLSTVCAYDVVVLDLAWSVKAEQCVMDLIYDNLDVLRKHRRKLENTVEGFAILHTLCKLSVQRQHRIPEVWVASAYVPYHGIGFPVLLSTDYGVLPHKIFHKWRDEGQFAAAVRRLHYQGA